MSRVLITDDSLLQRKTLSSIVVDMGHEVETANNGQEAMEKIQANPPDCLLLDMLMPVMSGDQLLEELHAQGIKLPIIVLSADVQEWLKERCKELGATTFINKPAKQDILRATIENVLSTPTTSEASCS